jgi:proline iminopeptidase
MATLKHKFGKTFYLSKGRNKKDKAALICLHGGPGGRHNTFLELFEKTKDRKILIYDQIGGGKSTPLKKPDQKMSTFLYELDQLRKHLKIDKFHLYGGSWGTTLALEYYFHCKGQGIQSITFQSPMFSAKDWENDANRLIEAMPTKTQKVIKYCHEIGATDSKVYKDAVFQYYLKHVLRDRKKLMSAISPNPHGQEVYMNMWGPSEFKPTGTLKTYNKVHLLKRIKTPTQLVVGEYDEATPQTARKYAKLVKNAEFHIIKKASHAILSEQPKKMLSAVNSFIQKHDPKG